MKIFGDIISGNCLKIKYTVDYLNLPYEWVDVDVLKKETRTPEFLAMNPFGQVPVVKFADGRVLSQSNAIIKYIARGSDLVPEDDFEQALMDQWLFWEQYSHEPAVAVLRFKRFYLKQTTADIDPNLVSKAYTALETMEKHLYKNKFFVADRFTLADISLLAYTRLSGEAGLDLNLYSHLRQWIKACEDTLNLPAIAPL